MRPATQMPAIYPASTPDASSRARDLFALSSDLHRHLWQEVRDDELRHALYSEGDGVAAGPLSKRVDQCNRQLARRVLCGGAILNIVAAVMALVVLRPMRRRRARMPGLGGNPILARLRISGASTL